MKMWADISNVYAHLWLCVCFSPSQLSESAPDVQGTTTMLLTRVPHFRDIMVASFECEQCNFRYYARNVNW